MVVTCHGRAAAPVEVVYEVRGAGWNPTHEARLDETRGSIELRTFADVHQDTGEPWSNVRLTLTTGRGLLAAEPPELAPLGVWARERERRSRVVVERSEAVPQAPTSAAADASTGTRVEAEGGLVAVRLQAADLADVAGDGSTARIEVGRSTGDARVILRAIPKLAPGVFRVFQITNRAPFPLLAGEVALFEGERQAMTFVGRQRIDETPSGARLELTFGQEQTLRAKRITLEERTETTGLLGGTREHRRKYRFYLANRGTKAAEVELIDQIPVSELEEVAVKLARETSPGHAIDARDGIVRWKVPLGAGEERALELGFTIDTPKSWQMAGTGR